MTADPSALEAVATLSDDLRRGMYVFIRAARAPVTRDEAAASVGISRKLAAFHLDKLVAAGLLTARYANPSGIRRVGRTPKVYEPSAMDLQISIPHREHGLLAGILLSAVREQRGEEHMRTAALRVAGERGRALGEAENRPVRGGRLGVERAFGRTTGVLGQHGFEPDQQGPELLRLRNCPFHPMAAEDPELVCGVNHAFLCGVVDGLGATAIQADLVPDTGYCCVQFTPRTAAEGE